MEAFLLGLGMGLLIDYLIVPGLSIQSTFVHGLTMVLMAVMIIFQIQYVKAREWEKINQEKLEEWNKKHRELYDKIIELLGK